jgi:hypothetical protein
MALEIQVPAWSRRKKCGCVKPVKGINLCSFCRSFVCPFVLFILATVFSVLRFTDSGYLFGIFIFFLFLFDIIVWTRTSEAGTAYPSRAPKFTPYFFGGSCYSIFCFMFNVFIDLRLSFCPICFGHCVVKLILCTFDITLWTRISQT